MIWGESRTRPMHVGGFMIFRIPSAAAKDYVRQLVRSLRSYPITAAPWNYRLARRPSGFMPAWEVVKGADIDWHVLHHALPAPGRETELLASISRLHSQPMNMARPLWEYHLIEGLGRRRFAIYLKAHHALFDGAGGIQAFVKGVSKNPSAAAVPVWTAARARRQARILSGSPDPPNSDEPLAEIPALYAAIVRLADAALGGQPDLIAPYTGPDTLFGEPVTQNRSIATQSLALQRVKAVARRTGTTVNDVFLAVCGGAIRRYLQERGTLPKASLTAAVPVALPHIGVRTCGNDVGLICASLATDLQQPLRRLRAIARTTRAGKEHLQKVPARVRTAYTILIVLPAFVHSLLPCFGKPIGNVAVSNMAGPQGRLYLNGALLEEVYPTSVLTAGCALNISCVSYHDRLYLGLVGCPDVIQHIEHMPIYMSDAFTELEAAAQRRRVFTKRPVPGKLRDSASFDSPTPRIDTR
jgi:diacylglycerol O-acyltransferase / wax synthase